MPEAAPNWVPRRCSEATNIAGSASVGSSVVVTLPKLHGKEVLFVGSSDATVHALERAGSDKILTRIVIPKRVEHERIQCLCAFVRAPTQDEDDDCCAIVITYFNVTSQAFSLIASNVWFRVDGSIDVSPHFAVKSFPGLMVLRLFYDSTFFKAPHNVLISAIALHDDIKCREKHYATESIAIVAHIPEVGSTALSTEQWKVDSDCGASSSLRAILCLAAGALCSMVVLGETVAAGCINGEVLVATGGVARVIKRLSGPISDIKLFSSSVMAERTHRCELLSSLLKVKQEAKRIRLVALDSTGSVLVASDLDKTEVRLELLDDVAVFVPNAQNIAANDSIHHEELTNATNPGSAGEGESTFGRVKATLLGRKKPQNQPARFVTCSESSESGTAAPLSQMPARCVGNVLSRGPTSVCIIDFNGDGINEMVLSTMGRALVFCSYDASSCKYTICGTQTAPTQMFFMHVLKAEYPDKEDLLVLCGPRHVLVTATAFSSLPTEKLRIIDRLLQQRQRDFTL